jgi:DNA-binding SARP family transcriptional activator/tetratricopeptide (TPR) repeat protein/DNA-binding XRE family transcriptional regulator
MDQELVAFSAALRAHRTRSGLTQRQLAEAAGVSVRTVRAIEQGQVERPRTASLRQLAAVVGLDEPVDVAVGIGVLGPLTVHRAGLPVPVGPLKQRCLLGLLALHPNQVVPQSEIVDVLWGDSPPDTYRDLLYAYVSRLRKVLQPARIDVTSGSGYLLRVDRDQLDLLRFDDSADLWRGPVLADLPDRVRQHPTARAIAHRRSAAVFADADAATTSEHHARAVPRLRALLAEEPLHEELHARLMVALAGSGQQGVALELYAEFKARLADELGVEPGTELQRAHLRVVRQEAGVAPRQLPAPPSNFVGRDRELAEVDTGVTVISGTGGIGKTWLALAWAHRNATRFPDGQLYVNLRGFDPAGAPLAVEDALRAFLQSFGVEPAAIPRDPDEQAALYRSLVVDKTLLVVLDNARDSAQVVPLLPGGPACTVLVTSRSGLPGLITAHSARPVTLSPLPEVEARELLTRRLGAARTAAEPAAVEEILRWCAGLPLALGIVAARAGGARLATLAAELGAEGERLSALDAGELPVDLRAVFGASRAALSAGASRLFGLLGTAPGPDISLVAAVALAGDEVRPLLRELVTAHLVQEHATGRYRMHDLVRLFAAEVCDEVSALHRVVDFYLHSALACDRVLYPHRPPVVVDAPGCVPYSPPDLPAAMAWTEAEHAALLAVAELGLEPVTWQLARATDVYHWRSGRVRDSIAMWRSGLAAAERSGGPAVVALANRSLGDNHANVGNFAAALLHLERAVALSVEIGDLTEEAHAHNSLAWAWEGQQDYGAAVAHARRALDLYRQLDRPQWEADMLNCVGWCLIRLGSLDEGRAHCEKALALCEEHGHVDGAAHASKSLGDLALEIGDHAAAQRRYLDALDLCRILCHPFTEAGLLSGLGEAQHALGRDDLARASWERALDLYRSQHRVAAAQRVGRRLERLLLPAE